MKIGAYAKVAHAGVGSPDEAIQPQMSLIEDWAKQNEAEVAETFHDVGPHPAKGMAPGLANALEAIRSGRIDRVVMTAPDRLARDSQRWLENYRAFEAAGAPVIFAGSPMDTAMARTMLIFAEYEQIMISKSRATGRKLAQQRRATPESVLDEAPEATLDGVPKISLDETLAVWERLDAVSSFQADWPTWSYNGFDALWRVRELVNEDAAGDRMLKLVGVLGMENESEQHRVQDSVAFATFTLTVQMAYAMARILRENGIDPTTI